MAILKLAPALKDYLWGGQRWIRCWEPIGVTSPITSSVSSISSPSIRRSSRRPATNNRETKNTCESEMQVFLFCIVLSDYCLTKCIVTPKEVDLTPPSSFLKVIFASPVSLKPSDNSSQLALVTSSPEARTASGTVTVQGQNDFIFRCALLASDGHGFAFPGTDVFGIGDILVASFSAGAQQYCKHEDHDQQFLFYLDKFLSLYFSLTIF